MIKLQSKDNFIQIELLLIINNKPINLLILFSSWHLLHCGNPKISSLQQAWSTVIYYSGVLLTVNTEHSAHIPSVASN